MTLTTYMSYSGSSMKKRRPPQAPPAPSFIGWRRRLRWRWALLLGGGVAIAGVLWGVARGSGDERQCVSDIAYMRNALSTGDPGLARSILKPTRELCGPKHAAELDVLGEEIEAAIDERDAAERASRTAELQKRTDAAAKVWRAFDALPQSKQTQGALIEAMAEAKTHEAAAFLSVAAYNKAMARFRMARLINPEARAKGDRGEVLVPSADRAKCLVWGSQWSQDAESLRSLGFEKIRCEEHTFTSSLTGEKVAETAREWPLP